MLGSMFVGLLVGFLAGTLTNRGERMGCFGKMFLGWIGAFIGHLLFGTWGTDNSRNCHYSGSTRFHDCLSDFLETRKLIS